MLVAPELLATGLAACLDAAWTGRLDYRHERSLFGSHDQYWARRDRDERVRHRSQEEAGDAGPTVGADNQ